MLIYHFGSKEALIADVLELANRRLSGGVTAFAVPPRSARQVVERAWQVLTSPPTDPVARLYLELTALSVREGGQWAGAHRRLREPWLALLRDNLIALPMPRRQAALLATVRVDAAARAFGRLLPVRSH